MIRKRLAKLLDPGAKEADELRRKLAKTREKLADQRERLEYWKEEAKRLQNNPFPGTPQMSGPSSRPALDPEEASLYLDLMKRTVSGWVYADGNIMGEKSSFDPSRREHGTDWPESAQTMIGLKRLDNLQFCVEDALANDVPGDLVETGVWRGGATIFMRAVLKAYGVKDRNVWVVDSFEGLPPPDPKRYPQDAGLDLSTIDELAISLEQVKSNFERYGLLDEQVRFLKGFFSGTLPGAPIEKLAVLRLDGDLYESTMDALVNLYPKLSVGGYCLVDDYGAIPACSQAVHDYREAHGIDEEIVQVDWSGVYWRRTTP